MEKGGFKPRFCLYGITKQDSTWQTTKHIYNIYGCMCKYKLKRKRNSIALPVMISLCSHEEKMSRVKTWKKWTSYLIKLASPLIIALWSPEARDMVIPSHPIPRVCDGDPHCLSWYEHVSSKFSDHPGGIVWLIFLLGCSDISTTNWNITLWILQHILPLQR